MNIPTTEKLAKALEEAGAPLEMIEKAHRGFYDDYKSPIGNPIMQLVIDSRAHRLHDIEQRAKDGEFDGTKEEADAWSGSEEGQQMLREFMGGKWPQAPNRATRRKRK